MPVSLLIESVEFVWLIWLTCVVILLVATKFALANMRWKSVRDFCRDDEGASYALPYVMTLPFLLLIFCCALQGTFILIAKFGTIHAAYAAGRSAIVWQGADPNSNRASKDLADFHADRAAVLGMTPFAAGVKMAPVSRMLMTTFPTRGGRDAYIKGRAFYDPMYRRYAKISTTATPSKVIKNPNALAKKSYINQKLLVAACCTNATIKGGKEVTSFNDDLEVQVTYKMPLQIPLGAPIFDSGSIGARFLGGSFYARTITSTVKLPSEAPQTSRRRLEVPYFPEEI